MKNYNVRKIFVAIIGLIGIYAFISNNVGRLPGQIILNTHPDIFYKAFIPLLMFVSAAVSFVKIEKKNYFYLSIVMLLIDSINRLAVLINHYYSWLTYGPITPPMESKNVVIVTNYHIASHMILFLEVVLAVYIFRYLYTTKNPGRTGL